MEPIISEREKKWINCLLGTDFKGKEILLEQITLATIYYHQEYSFISLKFHITNTVVRYPFDVRVPVEMRAYQEQSAPIVFLLHVIDGVIDEVEIITADSSKIEPEHILLTKVEYDINNKVIM